MDIDAAAVGILDIIANQFPVNIGTGSATESLGFKEANLYLKDRLAGFGLGVTEQSDYRNIIAELHGTQSPERLG